MGTRNAFRKADVKIGETYLARVSQRLCDVRIEREHPRSGWVGTNLTTGREVLIKSAARLRAKVGKRYLAMADDAAKDATHGVYTMSIEQPKIDGALFIEMPKVCDAAAKLLKPCPCGRFPSLAECQACLNN